MRVPVIITGLAVFAAIAASCTGTGINTAPLYTEQRGTVTLEVEVPEDQTANVTVVEFRVDNDVIGSDTDGAPFSIQWDTTKILDGIHYVKAIGNPGNGEIELLNNSVYVRNGSAPTAP